jgi:hypothetical protein
MKGIQSLFALPARSQIAAPYRSCKSSERAWVWFREAKRWKGSSQSPRQAEAIAANRGTHPRGDPSAGLIGDMD